jgi:hypothetical protein
MRVFENRVLRRMFGSKREEVTGDWGRLHGEELNAAYSPPNVFRVFKSRRRWYVLVETRGKNLGVNGKIKLQWFFKKWDGEPWTELLWLRIWTGGGGLWMQ